MNTARLSKYEVIARLSRSGSSPKDSAIEGRAVAITVESKFSMNKAQATMSGTTTRRTASDGIDALYSVRRVTPMIRQECWCVLRQAQHEENRVWHLPMP